MCIGGGRGETRWRAKDSFILRKQGISDLLYLDFV